MNVNLKRRATQSRACCHLVKIVIQRSAATLLVKPGMTGLWQINGRSELSWDESVRFDLYYVENSSPISDPVILWRTARAVLRASGAY